MRPKKKPGLRPVEIRTETDPLKLLSPTVDIRIEQRRPEPFRMAGIGQRKPEPFRIKE